MQGRHAQIPILIAEKNNALQIIATDFLKICSLSRKISLLKKLEHNIVLQKEDAKCFRFQFNILI